MAGQMGLDQTAQITVKFQGDSSSLENTLKTLQTKIDGLSFNKKGNIQQDLDKMGNSISNINKTIADSNGKFNDAALKSINQEYLDLVKNLSKVQEAIKQVTSSDVSFGNTKKDLDTVNAAVKKYEQQLKDLIKTSTNYQKIQSTLTTAKQTFTQKTQRQYNSRLSSDGTKYYTQLYNNLEKQQKELEDKLPKNWSLKDNKVINKQTGQPYTKSTAAYAEVQQYQAILNQLNGLDKNTWISQHIAEYKKLIEEVHAAEKAEKDYKNGVGTAYTNDKNTINRKVLNDLSKNQSIDLSAYGNPSNVLDLQRTVDQTYTQEASGASAAIDEVTQSVDNFSTANENFGRSINNSANELTVLTDKQNDVQNFTNRLLHFFSLTNSFQLFRRAVSGAVSTIKDLDAVMTEAAVVTENTVSDMWSALDEYSERANQLGVTIHDAYESVTLFLQQGLSMSTAVDVSNESLKLSRIAGLDAAEATDRLTNAMRGFNMEVSQTSAERVNDVYSTIAAKTASDVDELSVAMTKVASLAASANMGFENTAAFLGKIIETTRESAETAGTALKTVIARFSEVKELYSEGELLGTDEDGNEIDVNNISSALRTAGINLNEYLTGMKGLDEIMIDLGEKWDTLSIVQQRYIATQAAGSRQQSRFLALMQDFARTEEIMSYATNSAGASQEQFNKTLDSMESKINKLKNAWNTFLMGIANNEIIKFLVDALTSIINVINKITSVLPGITKSFANLAIAIGGLSLGKNIIKNFGQSIGLLAATAGESSGKGFVKSFTGAITKTLKSFKPSNLINTKNINLAKTTSYESILANERSETTQLQIEKELNNARAHGLSLSESEAFIQREINSLETTQKTLLGQQYEDKLASTLIDDKNLTNEEKLLLLKSEELKASYQKSIVEGGVSKEKQEQYYAELKIKILQEKGVLYAKLYSAQMTVQKVLGKEQIANLFTQLKLTKLYEKLMKTTNLEALGIIGLIAAGVAAVVAGIAVAINAIDQASLENQLKRAQETTEEMKTAAASASQAYDDLLSDRDEYNELQDALDDLIVGTDEWKQKLIEANNEVIELIGNYTGLAKYVTNENGQLTISSEGWDKLIEEQLVAVQNTANAQLLAQAHEASLNQQIQEKAAQDAINNKNWAYGNNREELLAQLTTESETARAMAEAYGTEMKSILSSMYLSNNNYGNNELADEVADILASNIDAYDEDKIRMRYQAGGFDKQKYYDENGEVINETVQARYQQLAEQYLGYTSQQSFNRDEESMRELYSAMSGIAIDELEDMEKSDLEIGIGQLDEAANAANRFSSVMDKLVVTGNKYNSLLKALSGSGTLKKTELPTGEENDGLAFSAKLTQMAEDMGYQNSIELLEELGYSYNEAWEQYQSNIAANQEGWGKAKINSESQTFISGNLDYNSQVMTLFDTIEDQLADTGVATLDQYQDYLSQVVTIYGKGGSEAAERFNSTFTSLLSSMSEEDQQTLLNSLSGYDFTDVTSIEEFIDSISEIDSSIPTNSLEQLKDELIELGVAVRDIDLSTLVSNFSSLLGMAKDFEDAESNGVSDEDYEELIKILPTLKDSFTYDGEQWVYTDGTMQDLASAVRENTNALIDSSKADIEEQIEKGKKVKVLLEAEDLDTGQTFGSNNRTFSDLVNNSEISTDDVDAVSEFLTEILKESVDNLSTTQILDKYKELIQSYIDLDTNKTNLNNYTNQIGGAAPYQSLLTAEAGTIETGQFQELDSTELEQYKKLLDSTISQTANLSKEVDELTEAYKAEGYSINDAKQRAKEMVVQTNKVEEAIDDLRSAIGDELDVLNDTTASEDTLGQSYFRIAQAANQVFSEEVTQPFVEENIELFKEWEAGSTTAYTEICNKLNEITIQKWLEINQNTDSGLQNVADAVNLLDGIEFDIYGFADFTDIQNAANVAGIDVLNLINLISQLDGYSINWSSGDLSQLQQALDLINGGNDPTGMRLRAGLEILESLRSNLGSITVSKTPVNGGGTGSYTPSTDSGGGDSDNIELADKAYDELFNLSEQLNASIREREKLEREYNRLLENEKVTGKDLIANQLAQQANLKKQIAQQEQMLVGRNKLLQNALDKQIIQQDSEGNDFYTTYRNTGVDQYAWYDEELGQVQIDWDKYNAITDPDSQEVVDQWIEYLQELVDNQQEAEDSLEDLKDELEELEERNQEEYGDFLDRIYEAVVASYQKIIDEYEELSDTIDETNNNILEAVAEAIDLERQIRDNTEKEEDIADKEAQLAYLQRDTSGANDLEIMKLQEEIDDARQDYTDDLIDQKIDELKEQNDKASEQREKQIELMQAQLDRDEENGRFWDQVNGLLKNEEALTKLLWGQDGVDAMSEFGKGKWLDDLQLVIAQALEGESNWRVESAKESGENITINGQTVHWDGSNFVDDQGNIYNDVSYDRTTGEFTAGSVTNLEEEKKKQYDEEERQRQNEGNNSASTPTLTVGSAVRLKSGAKLSTNSYEYPSLTPADWTFGQDLYIGANGGYGDSAPILLLPYASASWSEAIGWVDKKQLQGFKTGGLADFTGPAWLDGTKASPELVLNSQDTANFITLKNILGDLLNGKIDTKSDKSSGDNYFDIDINVDEIGEDYDVDQLAEKVKDQIYQDASYKNVNVINRLR